VPPLEAQEAYRADPIEEEPPPQREPTFEQEPAFEPEPVASDVESAWGTLAEEDELEASGARAIAGGFTDTLPSFELSGGRDGGDRPDAKPLEDSFPATSAARLGSRWRPRAQHRRRAFVYAEIFGRPLGMRPASGRPGTVAGDPPS
jgi:hypothetical protein